MLTNKVYADGNDTAYSYEPDGQLKTRTWARGVVTTYTYDDQNQLTEIDYSDSTPDITFTYDRLGRQETITDVLGTRTNVYDASTLQLTEERLPDGTILDRTYDALGRSAGYVFDPGGSAASQTAYAYDALGRFVSITGIVEGATNTAAYAYLPNSDLLEIVDIQLATCNLQRATSYEPHRDLITQIENEITVTSVTSVVSSYTYTNDELGRRTRRDHSGSAFTSPDIINYGYNERSEVVSATSLTNALYEYAYNFDPIGNRNRAEEAGITNLYLANELNQYTQITNNTEQITSTYDADGNMLTNGDWTYTWNGENRLILASNATTVVENHYDYMGRRIMKKVYDTSDLSTPTSDIQYTYDQWNMIRETTKNQEPGTTNTNDSWYVWGLDLSQTLQGAGGVGGLLFTTKDQGPGTKGSYAVAYDANGNISEYIDSTGAVMAHYEYDPFGNTTVSSGTMVGDFAYGFSTKYQEAETGWYYYGFRYYSPELGRWLNRDPVNETSFKKISALVSTKITSQNIRQIMFKLRHILSRSSLNISDKYEISRIFKLVEKIEFEIINRTSSQ